MKRYYPTISCARRRLVLSLMVPKIRNGKGAKGQTWGLTNGWHHMTTSYMQTTGTKQAVMYAEDKLWQDVYPSMDWCAPACMQQKKKDLYQMAFNLYIHSSVHPSLIQRKTERESKKVSERGLFPHDLPLILKQEYIISQIQFERRALSAFCLSSPAMGRDWDGW